MTNKVFKKFSSLPVYLYVLTGFTLLLFSIVAFAPTLIVSLADKSYNLFGGAKIEETSTPEPNKYSTRITIPRELNPERSIKEYQTEGFNFKKTPSFITLYFSNSLFTTKKKKNYILTCFSHEGEILKERIEQVKTNSSILKTDKAKYIKYCQLQTPQKTYRVESI